MKLLILGALLLSSMSFAQTPMRYASASTGGGNGGQTIYRGNNAYLRDITEKNNCIWKKYDQIINEVPSLGEILRKTYTLNSSFAYRIEEEIASLGYCFTTKRLPYLQYNNSDDIHIFANQEYDQVAINDSGIVFIDVNIFSKMDVINKAYLFMHESAHELFNKQEARSTREPRLREFLMNLFEQLDIMVTNQNTQSFDYIITQAKFTALEEVTTLDKAAFEVVFLNDPNVSLANKVSALKSLKYSINTQNLFSRILKANIQSIESQRVAKISEILRGTSLATTKANFPNLVKAFGNAEQYVYGDENKLQTLNDAISAVIQDQDLSDDLETLKKAFSHISFNNGHVFVAGLIAKNYDAVHGEGMFLNGMAETLPYLKVLIFGEAYLEVEDTIVRCRFGQGAGNQQCYETRETPYSYYAGKDVLGNNEQGLLKPSTSPNSLTTYVLASLKNNKWFVNKILPLVEQDLERLKSSSSSSYTLPQGMKIKDMITKNGKVLSDAKFKGSEKKEQIRLRENLIKTLKNL